LTTPTEPLLTAIAHMFQIYPADTRTLADLGQQVGASERTLWRFFRCDLGMTFPSGDPAAPAPR